MHKEKKNKQEPMFPRFEKHSKATFMLIPGGKWHYVEDISSQRHKYFLLRLCMTAPREPIFTICLLINAPEHSVSLRIVLEILPTHRYFAPSVGAIFTISCLYFIQMQFRKENKKKTLHFCVEIKRS